MNSVKMVLCLVWKINSSIIHTYNRKINILAIGEGPEDGLDDTSITENTKYSANIN